MCVDTFASSRLLGYKTLSKIKYIFEPFGFKPPFIAYSNKQINGWLRLSVTQAQRLTFILTRAIEILFFLFHIAMQCGNAASQNNFISMELFQVPKQKKNSISFYIYFGVFRYTHICRYIT